MRCAELESRFEAVADGSAELSPDERAHVASCAACSARLQRARDIEQWLATREVPEPPPSFTAAVMMRVGREKWRTERAFDIGFNLAIAAGVLVILGSAIGVAWSLGLLDITIDADLLGQILSPQLEARVTAQLQTIVIATALLASALALWWWAETAAE